MTRTLVSVKFRRPKTRKTLLRRRIKRRIPTQLSIKLRLKLPQQLAIATKQRKE